MNAQIRELPVRDGGNMPSNGKLDRESDELLLEAYVSSNGPSVNKLLVRRTMSEGNGFIWHCEEEDEVNDTMAGIYVPLLWQGEALGVICVIVDILNTYFSPLIQAIFKYDGIIDKFIGDALLAVFGSPEPDAKQHKKAVQAAWKMLAAVKELNTRRKAQGQVTCEIGIGIHCGEVLHGFIGAADQVEFTVIGDAVNRALRYCDGAEAGEVLISPEVYQRVWEIVKEKRTHIETRHEGALTAYRIKNVEPS